MESATELGKRDRRIGVAWPRRAASLRNPRRQFVACERISVADDAAHAPGLRRQDSGARLDDCGDGLACGALQIVGRRGGRRSGEAAMFLKHRDIISDKQKFSNKLFYYRKNNARQGRLKHRAGRADGNRERLPSERYA
jgi:hypothetical protein